MTDIRAEYDSKEWNQLISSLRDDRKLPEYFEQRHIGHRDRRNLTSNPNHILSLLIDGLKFFPKKILSLSEIDVCIKSMPSGPFVAWQELFIYLSKDPARAGLHEKDFGKVNSAYVYKLNQRGDKVLVPFGNKVVLRETIEDSIAYTALDFEGKLKDNRRAFIWHKCQNNFGGNQRETMDGHKTYIAVANNLNPKKYFILFVCEGTFYTAKVLKELSGQCKSHVAIHYLSEANDFISENFALQ